MKKEKKPKKEKVPGKGGKKKLLLIPVVLIVIAAVAAAVVLFVLPRFGINLLGGGDDPGDSSSLEEPLPKKGLEAYTLGEDTTIALDTLLTEGEGELIALRSPNKPKGDESSNVDTRLTYIYELTSPATVMNRYLDAVLGGEQGFSVVDESYVVVSERPELVDDEGAFIIARPSVVEGHIFQLVIGWSHSNETLVVRVSAPEGSITTPKPEEKPEPTSVSQQMEQLRGMTPGELGLPGASMDGYTIFPVDGFVMVDGQECRRFNVYPQGDPGAIAGTYLLSTDNQHVYVLDPTTDTVSTIR